MKESCSEGKKCQRMRVGGAINKEVKSSLS